MKKNLLKIFIVATIAIGGIFTYTLTSVNAQSVYEEYSLDTLISEEDYTLEDMLNYAISDEFLAKAEYEAIIATFGEVMPFVRIVEAEATHISMLLPLFETYGFEVPADNSSEFIVIPESITSALATGVEAEEYNIAMYEYFLSQDNLPDDVRSVFEYLMQASEQHLNAFSQDRYSYYGTDALNQIKNQFQKMNKGGDQDGNGNQYKGSNGKRNSQESSTINQENCIN
ncbi:MAG: DUF2202 domain-containing protein [Tenericutes bacterium]|nr:DUF2202 domain-containing protein [Mycoplasmatota bacterium]